MSRRSCKAMGSVGVKNIFMVEDRWKALVKDDDLWVPKAVETGCIVVTVDRNMLSRNRVIEAIANRGGRMVVFSSFFAHLIAFDQLAFLMRYWETIVSRVEAAPSGHVVLVYRDGRTKTGEPKDFAHKPRSIAARSPSGGAASRSQPPEQRQFDMRAG